MMIVLAFALAWAHGHVAHAGLHHKRTSLPRGAWKYPKEEHTPKPTVKKTHAHAEKSRKGRHLDMEEECTLKIEEHNPLKDTEKDMIMTSFESDEFKEALEDDLLNYHAVVISVSHSGTQGNDTDGRLLQAPACDTYHDGASCSAAGCMWDNAATPKCQPAAPAACDTYQDGASCSAAGCMWDNAATPKCQPAGMEERDVVTIHVTFSTSNMTQNIAWADVDMAVRNYIADALPDFREANITVWSSEPEDDEQQFHIELSRRVQKWSADLGTPGWGHPSGKCCALRKTLALRDILHMDLPHEYKVDPMMGCVAEEYGGCEHGTPRDYYNALNHICRSDTHYSEDHDEHCVSGANITLHHETEPEMIELPVSDLCEAREFHWEIEDDCDGDYDSLVQCPSILRPGPWGPALQFRALNWTCCDLMNVVAAHYVRTLGHGQMLEGARPSEEDLMHAKDMLKESPECGQSVLTGLTHGYEEEDDEPAMGNVHLRAFALDANMNCKLDSKEEEDEDEEEDMVTCSPWPGHVSAGLQTRECCAAFYTVVNRIAIEQGFGREVERCMAHDLFGHCINATADDGIEHMNEDFGGRLPTKLTFRKALMSMCRGESAKCGRHIVDGLRNDEGSNSRGIAWLLDPDDNGVPELCYSDCVEHFDELRLTENAEYISHHWAEGRAVDVNFTCAEGYEAQNFTVRCHLLSGVSDRDLLAEPRCVRRRCMEEPHVAEEVRLFCEDEYTCTPGCSEDYRIVRALPYECRAHDDMTHWVGSSQCVPRNECTYRGDKVATWLTVHGCVTDDDWIKCPSGEFEVECHEGHAEEKLECHDGEFSTLPMCVRDDTGPLFEVSEMYATFIVELREATDMYDREIKDVILRVAHDKLELHKIKVLDIMNANGDAGGKVKNIDVKVSFGRAEPERMEWRGYGRVLGELGEKFEEEVDEMLSDRLDAKRVVLGDFNFITISTTDMEWYGHDHEYHHMHEDGHGDHDHEEADHDHDEHDDHDDETDVTKWGETAFQKFQVYVVYGEWCFSQYAGWPHQWWCGADSKWGCWCDEHFGRFTQRWWFQFTHRGRQCFKYLGEDVAAWDDSSYATQCHADFAEDVWSHPAPHDEEHDHHHEEHDHHHEEHDHHHGTRRVRRLRGRSVPSEL